MDEGRGNATYPNRNGHDRETRERHGQRCVLGHCKREDGGYTWTTTMSNQMVLSLDSSYRFPTNISLLLGQMA